MSLKNYANNGSGLMPNNPVSLSQNTPLVPQDQQIKTQELRWWDRHALKNERSQANADAARTLQKADIERRTRLNLLANDILGQQLSAALIASSTNNLTALMTEAANRSALAIDTLNHSEMASIMNHLDTRKQHNEVIAEKLQQGVITPEEAAFLQEIALQRAGESVQRASGRATLAKNSVDDLYATAIGSINRAQNQLKTY